VLISGKDFFSDPRPSAQIRGNGTPVTFQLLWATNSMISEL
jgi:hypothetical protein